jgi:hypothetical protein
MADLKVPWEIIKRQGRQEVDSKQDSKVGVIKRRYPDNKYDVAVENIGTAGTCLLRISTAKPEDVYNVGDSVIIDFPQGKIAYAQIRGRSNITIPEEEEYIFGVAEPTFFLTTGDSDTNFYAYDNEGNELSGQGFDLGYTNAAGVAFDGVYYYVTNTYAHTVHKYDTSGNLVASWGGYGANTNGKFFYSWDCAVSADNVFVISVVGPNVQKFLKDGTFVKRVSIGTLARGVATNGVNVVTIDLGSIRKFDMDLTLIGSYTTGVSSGRVIEIDTSGNIYWANTGASQTVKKLSSALALLATSSETFSDIDASAIDETYYYGIQRDGVVKVFNLSDLSFVKTFTIINGRGMCGNYLL